MFIKEAFELLGFYSNSDLTLVNQKVNEIVITYTYAANTENREYEAAKLLNTLLQPFDSNQSKEFITQLKEVLGAIPNSEWRIQKPYIKAILQWQMTKNQDFLKNLASVLHSNSTNPRDNPYLVEIMRELLVAAKIKVKPRQPPESINNKSIYKLSNAKTLDKLRNAETSYPSSARKYLWTPKQIESEKAKQKEKYKTMQSKVIESTKKIEEEVAKKILLSYEQVDTASRAYKNYVQAVKIYENFGSIENKKLMDQEWEELRKKLILKEKKVETSNTPLRQDDHKTSDIVNKQAFDLINKDEKAVEQNLDPVKQKNPYKQAGRPQQKEAIRQSGPAPVEQETKRLTLEEQEKLGKSLTTDIRKYIQANNQLKADDSQQVQQLEELQASIITNLRKLSGYSLPSILTQALLMSLVEILIKKADKEESNLNYLTTLTKINSMMSDQFLERLILGKGQLNYDSKKNILAENGENFVTSLMLSGHPQYSRVLMLQPTDPEPTVINPNTILMKKTGESVTVFWMENQQIRQETLQASSFNEALPEPGHFSIAKDLLIEITERCGCVQREYDAKELIKRPLLRDIKHDFSKIRATLFSYVERSSKSKPKELNQQEHEKISTIHVQAIEALKNKWNAIRRFFDTLLSGEENIKHIVYEDLREKALEEKLNLPAPLANLLKKHQTFEQFTKKENSSIEEDKDYTALGKHIANMADRYLTVGAEENAKTSKVIKPASNKDIIEDKTTSNKEKDAYFDLIQTVGFLFKTPSTVPNFITREDLVKFFLYDATRLLNLDFEKNISLLQKLGDLDKFIHLLELQKKKLKNIGIVVPENIDLVIYKLENIAKPLMQKQQQEEYKKYAEYIASWKNNRSFVEQINEISGNLEAKLAYDTQLNNLFSLLNKKKFANKNKLAKLPIEVAEYSNFRRYLVKINNIGRTFTNPSALLEVLNSYDKELIATFKNFKQAEEILKAKKNSKGYTLTASEAADYQEVQQALKEIMTLHERISTLAKKYSTHKKTIAFTKANIVNNELSVAPASIRGKKIIKRPSKKGMILYFIIMTEKSISEKTPTRAYLDKLYSNQEVNTYLAGKTQAAKRFKKQIQALEKKLVKEKVQQLRFASQRAVASTDRSYFIIDPNTHKPLMESTNDNPAPYKTYSDKLSYKIQDEIVSCKDSLARAKLIEHWIYIMEEAHKNKDQFTAGIVKDALISAPVNRLFSGEHASTFISKEAKNIFIQCRDLFNPKGHSEEMEQFIKNNNYDFVPHPSIAFVSLANIRAVTDEGKMQPTSSQRPIDRFLEVHNHLQNYVEIDSQLATEIAKYSVNDPMKIENELGKKSSSLQKEGHQPDFKEKEKIAVEASNLIKTSQPEEKKLSKEEKIKYRIKESIKEFYTVQKKFQDDMAVLLFRLSLTAKEKATGDKSYISTLINNFSADFAPCAISTFNEKMSNDNTIKDPTISDITKIVEAFERVRNSEDEDPDFTETLVAQEKAILGKEWVSNFIIEEEIAQNQIGYQNTLSDEVIKPVQIIPRYALKINDLIDQINDLIKLYKEEPLSSSAKILPDLQKLKERLTTQLSKLKDERIAFAKICDSGGMRYREIAYSLITCTTGENKQDIDKAAGLLREIPLIKFDAAIKLIQELQSKYHLESRVAPVKSEDHKKLVKSEAHINPQNYIKTIYQCEADRMLRQLPQNKENAKNCDPELIEISQRIAIDLLKKAHDKSPATQEIIRNATSELCKIPPPVPSKIIGILDNIKLPLTDRATKLKLERKVHRETVRRYLEKHSNNTATIKNLEILSKKVVEDDKHRIPELSSQPATTTSPSLNKEHDSLSSQPEKVLPPTSSEGKNGSPSPSDIKRPAVDSSNVVSEQEIKKQKACLTLAYTLQEFYESQKRFHSDMPAEKKDPSKTSGEKTPFASTFEEKLKLGLGKKLEDPIVSMHYANLMADYAGMDHDPFAGGFTLVINKDDPSSYSIEHLTEQAEKLHEQLQSEVFAKTCQAVVNSGIASGWAALFVKDNCDDEKLQAIQNNLSKPFQNLGRYKILIQAIKDNTNQLKKVAEKNSALERLEQAIANLETDAFRLHTNYLQQLQEAVDVEKFAKTLAYKFIEKSSDKKKTLAKKEVLQEAAKKLRELTVGSSYNNILDIIISLNKNKLTHIKTAKYCTLLMEQIIHNTESALRKVINNIEDAEKQKSVHDKDNNKPYDEEKNSAAIMDSLLKYLQIQEEQWEIKSKIKQSKNRTPGKKTQQKIKIAQSCHKLLKEIQLGKPLNLDKMANAISSFKQELLKIESKKTVAKKLNELDETVKAYVKMAKPNAIAQPLNPQEQVNPILSNQPTVESPLPPLSTATKENSKPKQAIELAVGSPGAEKLVIPVDTEVKVEIFPNVLQPGPPLPPPPPSLNSNNYTELTNSITEKTLPTSVAQEEHKEIPLVKHETSYSLEKSPVADPGSNPEKVLQPGPLLPSPLPSQNSPTFTILNPIPSAIQERKEIKRPPPGRPIQMSVSNFAATLAKHLFTDLKEKKGFTTNVEKTVQNLKELAPRSSYKDILNILENFGKETDLKILKYQTAVIEQATRHTEAILAKLTKDINNAKKADKTKNDDRSHQVVSSLLQYMQAFEIQLEVEGKVNKYIEQEKITATKFYRELLEQYKEEKPLSLDKVANVVNNFYKYLPQKVGNGLYKIINNYIETVRPGTGVQQLDIPTPTPSFAKNNTTTQQILRLQTPSDRRLGQLIALQPDRLSEEQIKALSAYIGWKNNPTQPLLASQQDSILATLKEIRKESSMLANGVVLTQIIEIKNAIDHAADNPHLRKELKKVLDEFEKNLDLIILPQQKLKATLEQVKEIILAARTSIQQAEARTIQGSPAIDHTPPPLTEMDRMVLAKIELRQALLEKREANAEVIEIKNSQDIQYEKLRSSYNLILPSIIKTIDQEFSVLITEQAKYLGELYEEYPYDQEVQEKLRDTWTAINQEIDKRKNSSSEVEIKKIKESLAPLPLPAKRSAPALVQPKNDELRKKEQKEKEIALAMLELRQGLIEQRMVSHTVRIEDADIDKDNLLSNKTKDSYKELNKKYGESRRENFDLAEYSKKIGVYKIGKKEDMTDPVSSAEEQKTLVLKIAGEEGYKILHSSNAIETAAAPKTARKLYLQYLQSALDKHTKQDKSDKVISMEELLGKTGKNLYRAAMQEEANDPAFINAVFLSAVENFRGPKWAKKLVLWIAGPSSSGKTYATKGMIKRIAQWVMPKETGEISNNYVVTIDGAIQREVSQMRKLTVDVAIELGYRGVKGVDKGTKGELKKRIRDAAETKNDLSIAIPDTLTKYALQVKNKIFRKLFKSHAQNENTLHVYSQIKSGESIDAQDTFALSVERMGESRAYIKIGKNHYSITIDGKVIIESKKYDKGKFGENFSLGIRMANIGKKIYRKIQKKFNQQAYDFDVIHDLMFVTLDKNKWRECSRDDKGDMRMITRRAFNAWLQYQKEHPELSEEDQYQQLDTWLADKKGGNKPTLTEPIINFYHNGIKKDYETEKLLTELQNLQKEAEKTDKSLSELQDLQKDAEKIKLKDTDPYKKISNFIIKIMLSKGKDPINVWKDHEADINDAKKELSNHLELTLANKMRIIEDWLKPENKALVPVDLIKIGEYIAYHASNDIPANLDAAKKKQLQGIISQLRNVPQAGQDQDLYIRTCINKIADLAVLDTQKFNRIHLAYAAAKVRDAYYKTLDKNQVTTVINGTDIEKNTASYLRSYLEALKNKWELEDLVAGGYKHGKDREYNNQRLTILKNAIEKLKTDSTFTLKSIQKMVAELNVNLAVIPTASPIDKTLTEGTEKAIKSLESITTKFINPVAAVINTREGFIKSIDNMKNALVNTRETPSLTREIVTNMKDHLETIRVEWKLSEEIGEVSNSKKEDNQNRLEILDKTIKKLSTANITLQQVHAELHNLQTNLRTVVPAADQERSDTTKQVCAQLEEMQIACVGPALYKTWLPPTASAQNKSPIENNSMKLLHLGHYIASLIDHECKTSANHDKEASSVIKALREIKESSEKDNLQQKFIYDTLSKLKDPGRFTSLLIKHAQATRRDLENKIAKESPTTIIKLPGIDIDKPNTYNEYVARTTIEYLKSIEAEWAARELTAGAGAPKGSYTEQRRILNQSIAALESTSNRTLDFINDNLKKLGTQLQDTLSKPTGLARIYIFSSRSQGAKKSAEVISQTQEDISSIKKMSDGYITPFIGALKKDEEMLKVEKEQKEKIAKTEERRIFLTGKDSNKLTEQKNKDGVEIKGTAHILRSFIQEVTTQQPFLVAQQLQKDKSIAEFTEYKEKNEVQSIKLDGWDAKSPAKISESTPSKAPNLDAKTAECRGLPSGMCIEYTLEKDQITAIRESNQNNHVSIGALQEPPGYDKMPDEQKLAIDITIAEAMVRLWVARCGTPIHISGIPNKSRMSAIIIVCEAHDLHYALPFVTKYNYSFLSNPKVELRDNISAVEREIKEGARAKITVLNDSTAMQKLETEFNVLKAHYEDKLKNDTTIPDEEKKRYVKEIRALKELIDNARQGKFSTKAANDAVMKLSKNLAEIDIRPAPRSSLRGG